MCTKKQNVNFVMTWETWGIIAWCCLITKLGHLNLPFEQRKYSNKSAKPSSEWEKHFFFWLSGGSRGSQSNTWSTTETWKYITREGKWVTVAPMLRPRTNHASATLNGEIYVIGGKKTYQFAAEGFRQMFLGQCICRTGHYCLRPTALSFHWQELQWILSKLNIMTRSVIAGLLRAQH